MRKTASALRTLLLFISITTTLECTAQFQLGPQAFFGRSVITSDYILEREGTTIATEFRNSFVAGIFFEQKLTKHFALQAEVMFNQLNHFDAFYIHSDTANLSYPVNPEEGNPIKTWETSNTATLNYLTFPLTFQLGNNRFSANMGAQYSYLLKGEQVHYNYSRSSQKEWTNKFDLLFYKNHNVSLVAGCSYKVFKELAIEARFSRGILNIQNPLTANNTLRSMQVLVGIHYGILSKKEQ